MDVNLIWIQKLIKKGTCNNKQYKRLLKFKTQNKDNKDILKLCRKAMKIYSSINMNGGDRRYATYEHIMEVINDKKNEDLKKNKNSSYNPVGFFYGYINEIKKAILENVINDDTGNQIFILYAFDLFENYLNYKEENFDNIQFKDIIILKHIFNPIHVYR